MTELNSNWYTIESFKNNGDEILIRTKNPFVVFYNINDIKYEFKNNKLFIYDCMKFIDIFDFGDNIELMINVKNILNSYL